MKVALIEYKVRIMPPEDASNELMDGASEVVNGEKHSVELLKFIERRLQEYMRTYRLDVFGFTVEVEELSE